MITQKILQSGGIVGPYISAYTEADTGLAYESRLDIAYPTNLQENDLLLFIAATSASDNNDIGSTPSGWTAIFTSDPSATYQGSMVVYAKLAVGDETGTTRVKIDGYYPYARISAKILVIRNTNKVSVDAATDVGTVSRGDQVGSLSDTYTPAGEALMLGIFTMSWADSSGPADLTFDSGTSSSIYSEHSLMGNDMDKTFLAIIQGNAPSAASYTAAWSWTKLYDCRATQIAIYGE